MVILRKIIPWQKITDKLAYYYNDSKGRIGTPIRTIVGIFIILKLRLLSDRTIVNQIKENRYIQYFCNVPDENLFTFMHHSNLSKLRKRFGIKGVEAIEDVVFNLLRITKVIDKDGMLIDSTVLLNNIAYPTDIGLIFADARPIKKGKKHPDCEFGSTLQLSFNRQGFMVTMENFIGKPNDKTLWPETTRLFEEKLNNHRP